MGANNTRHTWFGRYPRNNHTKHSLSRIKNKQRRAIYVVLLCSICETLTKKIFSFTQIKAPLFPIYIIIYRYMDVKTLLTPNEINLPKSYLNFGRQPAHEGTAFIMIC